MYRTLVSVLAAVDKWPVARVTAVVADFRETERICH